MSVFLIMTREENINKLLISLKDSVESVNGAALVSKRGLVISKVFDFKINARMLGGIAASIVGPTTRLANTLFKSETFSVNTVESTEGTAILMDMGTSIMLVVTKPQPNIGLILFEMESVGKKIEEAMK